MHSKNKNKSKIPKKSWRYYLFSVMYLPILLIQIVLTIFFFYEIQSVALILIGIILISFFFIFGWLPIHTLKIKGEAEGKSFAETTKLVKSGLYRYSRHPQFLSWVFLSLGLSCLSQYSITAILSLLVIFFVYLDALVQDTYLIEKFGQKYKDYMEKVPRMNPLMKIFK